MGVGGVKDDLGSDSSTGQGLDQRDRRFAGYAQCVKHHGQKSRLVLAARVAYLCTFSRSRVRKPEAAEEAQRET